MTGPDLARALERLLAEETPRLRAIPDGPDTARPNRPSGRGWSQREELGHLVDSAVNNHVRFAAAEGRFDGPGYDQERWVAVHGYAGQRWPAIVESWRAHNEALVPLLAGLTEERLRTPCSVGGAPPLPLRALAEDYLLHARHHLDQILRRSPVTPYPPG